jgi:hypothetical protein
MPETLALGSDDMPAVRPIMVSGRHKDRPDFTGQGLAVLAFPPRNSCAQPQCSADMISKITSTMHIMSSQSRRFA